MLLGPRPVRCCRHIGRLWEIRIHRGPFSRHDGRLVAVQTARPGPHDLHAGGTYRAAFATGTLSCLERREQALGEVRLRIGLERRDHVNA